LSCSPQKEFHRMLLPGVSNSNARSAPHSGQGARQEPRSRRASRTGHQCWIAQSSASRPEAHVTPGQPVAAQGRSDVSCGILTTLLVGVRRGRVSLGGGPALSCVLR
jgi:hypothetical protein